MGVTHSHCLFSVFDVGIYFLLILVIVGGWLMGVTMTISNSINIIDNNHENTRPKTDTQFCSTHRNADYYQSADLPLLGAALAQ